MYYGGIFNNNITYNYFHRKKKVKLTILSQNRTDRVMWLFAIDLID